jgi:hypothetical protein
VVALAGIRTFAGPLGISPNEWPASSWNFVWWGPQNFGQQRAQIETELSSLPGGQLAIVRYSQRHNPFNEWVYNAAEMDQSKVLWAREMDATDNSELLQYYRDRKAWLVEPDATPVRVTPYPSVAMEMKAGN